VRPRLGFRKQFRLSTAVAAMLLSGALVGLNVCPQRDTFKNHAFAARGWPLWWTYEEIQLPKVEPPKVENKAAAETPSELTLTSDDESADLSVVNANAEVLTRDSLQWPWRIDDGMLIPHHYGKDNGIMRYSNSGADIEAVLTKMAEELKERSELLQHTSQIERNLYRNAVFDSLGALFAIGVVAAALEFFLRKSSYS